MIFSRICHVFSSFITSYRTSYQMFLEERMTSFIVSEDTFK